MSNLKFKISYLVISAAVASAAFSSFGQVSAANLQDAFNKDATKPLGAAASNAGYETDESKASVENIIATVIQTLISFLGIIFLLLIIYGGYNWMTASGDNAKVELAKNTITRAAIGLIVVIGAYAISFFVINSLGGQTLQGDIINK